MKIVNANCESLWPRPYQYGKGGIFATLTTFRYILLILLNNPIFLPEPARKGLSLTCNIDFTSNRMLKYMKMSKM